MDVSRRRAASYKQIQALTAANAQLETANADLRTECDRLRQKIKFLQIAISISLGSDAGLAIGMAGVAASTLLTAATTVSFAVITVSLAILTYMRRG